MRISHVALIATAAVGGLALVWLALRTEPRAAQPTAPDASAHSAKASSEPAGASVAGRRAMPPGLRAAPPADLQVQHTRVTPTVLDPEDPEARFRRSFERAMRNLDANGDGGLSVEEIEEDPRIAWLAQRFDDSDQDQDGLLRADEVLAAVQSRAR